MIITNKVISYSAIPGLMEYKKFDGSKKRLTIEQVAERVCMYFGITMDQIKSDDRHDTVRIPRQIVMYICDSILVPTYDTQKIGNFFYKDHATVINARKKVQNYIDTDTSFRYNFMMILKRLEE